MLDLLDGLILAGGADYGESPERDAFELALAGAALERDVPLLGVCRGMQLMNVARGGSLIEHVPDTVGHEDHRATPGAFGDHDVRLAAGSLAARAAGARACTRPSRTTTRASTRSATASRSPAGRRSTTCPRRWRIGRGGSRSACSGTPRPTRWAPEIAALVDAARAVMR